MSGAKAVVLPAAEETALAAAVAALAQGELVIMPTDTVYGIGCRADHERAVARLFAAKGRGAEKALPVLVGGVEGLAGVCAITPALEGLAKAFWPGPLTVVVAKHPGLADQVTGGKATVGVRIPDCAPTRSLLAQCPFPVAVTSANLSGEPAAVCVAEVAEALHQHVAVILDGGTCPGLTPSTVVDLTVTPVRVLRAGPINAAALARVLGTEVRDV